MRVRPHLALIATVGIAIAALPATAPAASLAASPAAATVSAQTYMNVIQILESAGYEVTSKTSTLLGRIKIRARNHLHLREIVVSRSTGEVKSDRIIKVFGNRNGKDQSAAAPQDADQGDDGSQLGINLDAGTSGLGADVDGDASVSVGSGGAGIDAGLSIGIGD